MKRLQLFIAAAACLISLTCGAQSSSEAVAEAASAGVAPLVVGVRVAPPFVIEAEGDRLSGLSIRAWEAAATDLGREYRYVPAGLDEVLAGVEAGRFDVGLGAFTVTAEREKRLDFSHPFHTSGLGLAVRAEAGSGWLTLAGRFFSLDFLKVALSLGALLFAFGALAWVFERRANPEEFDTRVGPGLGAGFWWAAVTMTTVGYGDKSPRTLGGRIVALVWMFAAIIVISSFTAAITSSLTVSQLGSEIESIDDVGNRRVGTLPGSASEEWLFNNGFRATSFDTLEDALHAVAEGELIAVLYDAPLIGHALQELDGRGVKLLPQRIERLDYALVLAEGSELREPINRNLLELITGAQWNAAVERYLGAR